METISYKRKIFCQNKNLEIVLITWPRGSMSRAHDHGRSQGIIKILKGKIVQEIYSKRTKEFRKRSFHNQNEIFFETPDIIHKMGNASRTKTAKTIHIYTPKLKMTIYQDSQLKKRSSS